MQWHCAKATRQISELHFLHREKKKMEKRGVQKLKINKYIKLTKSHRWIYHAIRFSVGEVLQFIQDKGTVFYIETTQTTKQRHTGSLWKHTILVDKKGCNTGLVFFPSLHKFG